METKTYTYEDIFKDYDIFNKFINNLYSSIENKDWNNIIAYIVLARTIINSYEKDSKDESKAYKTNSMLLSLRELTIRSNDETLNIYKNFFNVIDRHINIVRFEKNSLKQLKKIAYQKKVNIEDIENIYYALLNIYLIQNLRRIEFETEYKIFDCAISHIYFMPNTDPELEKTKIEDVQEEVNKYIKILKQQNKLGVDRNAK